MEIDNRLQQISNTLKQQLTLLGSFVLLLWAIELVDWLIFRGSLDAFGIRPRTLTGLWGIPLAPLLHGSFQHLIANTVPFLVLGWLILSTRKLQHFLNISTIIVLVSGLGTWIIGPSRSVHLGASGLIFGYFGFLLLVGYFERSVKSILIAIVVFFLYGSLIWGVLPIAEGVSWQAHLFGFIGGAIAAYFTGKQLNGYR
ncbi:MAG: rhomboid family intramembrane serine protease [Chloroflexi bacterium]|nr:MAG: rhomboid family intramembrane serine protease [Chloroflexota bacterium]